MSTFNSLMAKADDALIATFNNDGGVTLWPGEAREVVIEAVFDNPYTRVDVPDGGKIPTSDPSFTAHDRDIVTLKKTDAVNINGQVYYVKELQPDGTGVTRVFASRYKKSSADQPGGLL
ncbi:head-tail joining protein [Cronobacter muytjensii]|uniref:head-tail joining protein n=1 Tax=Cronobacter muytjensii TaxID=413501 RepID=UPI002DBD7BB9|nr:head-tail joining protein [Cronobacter muytjensii]MEB8638653.1 head-tail joining protein [Cronobacter muytjensii]